MTANPEELDECNYELYVMFVSEFVSASFNSYHMYSDRYSLIGFCIYILCD